MDVNADALQNWRSPELHCTRGINGRPNIQVGRPWFVYYWYKNPETLRFERFKVYEGINKLQSVEDRLAFAKILIAKWTDLLTNLKFSPYGIPEDIGHGEFKLTDITKKFLVEKSETLDKDTLSGYDTRLRNFCTYCNKQKDDSVTVADITANKIKAFLSAGSVTKKGVTTKWSAKTYNDYLSLVHQFFAWVITLDESPVKINPATTLTPRPVLKSEANPPLTDAELSKITDFCRANKLDFLFYYLFMYYTCLRPTKESRLMKVKYIDPIRMQINIPATISKTGAKTGKGRTLPLAQQLLDIFIQRGTLNYNPEFFIFTTSGIPGPRVIGKKTMGRRYDVIKSKVGLREEVTMYGIKHTRVCHLVIDGEALYRIQQLTGHRTLEQLMDYLKGLNLIVEQEKPLNSRNL